MPSPTDAERIIISRERIIIFCAPGTLNFCADALRASNIYSAGVGAPTVRGPTLKIRGEELRNDFFVCADLTVRFHQLTDRTRNIYA